MRNENVLFKLYEVEIYFLLIYYALFQTMRVLTLKQKININRTILMM